MKRFAVALCLTGTLISGNALAWGDNGHRAIGAMADRLLVGTHAQARIAAILQPGETLELASIWADCVKSKAGSFCGPQSQEMRDYIEANPKHTEYHYTDVPVQDSAYRAGSAGTTDHDIVQLMQQAIAVLQGHDDSKVNPNRLTPRQALLLLAHLASDIHQPLHVGALYVDKNDHIVVPASNAEIDNVNIFDLAGGNGLFFADPSYDRAPYPNQPIRKQNLHAFWDHSTVEMVFKRVGVSSPDAFAQKALAGKLPAYALRGAVDSWPVQLADDALALSRLAHAPLKLGERTSSVDSKGVTHFNWALTAPDDYRDFAEKLAESQLVRGGYRFAAMLQQIWP